MYTGNRRVTELIRQSGLIQISPSVTAYVVGNEPVFRPLRLALAAGDFEAVIILAARLMRGAEQGEHEFRIRLFAFEGMAKVGLNDIRGAAESYRQANRIAEEHVRGLLPRMMASLINWESQLRWDEYSSDVSGKPTALLTGYPSVL